MIGRLKGTLEIKAPPLLLIEVNGLGYEVFVPMSTYYQLPELGNKVTLFTHFHIREDAQILYGFFEEKERALFRSLIKISGVGPKMALTILSGMDVNSFLRCVEYRDIDILVRLPGVGKKTAERLIIEMAGKLKTIGKGTVISESFMEESILKRNPKDNISSPVEDAVGALVSLGYKPQEAMKAISRIIDEANQEEEKSSEKLASHDIIRRALQSFAKI